MPTNIVEFAPALLRRRERSQQEAQVSRQSPWRSRYRDGIDGLWTRKPTGEVVQLVIPANRPVARIGETTHG